MIRDRIMRRRGVLATIAAVTLTAAGASLVAACTATPDAPATPRLPFTGNPGPRGEANGGVRSIFEDRDGNMWFGSHFEGVCRFDGTRLRWFTERDGLSDDQVRSIQQDSSGRVWFDTAVGVSSFDGVSITTHEAPVFRPDAAWSLEAEDLWFKSHDPHGFTEREGAAGVYRCRDGTLEYLAFPLLQSERTNGGFSATCIAKGRGGRVWIATYDAVFGFDGRGFTILDGARMGLREGEGLPHVRCVLEDSRGRVWIGNNGVGVIVVDGDRTYGLTPPVGTGDALGRMSAPLVDSVAGAQDRSLQRVFSLGEDRDGGIWIGTIGGGAWRYDGRTLRQFTEKDGLTTESVFAIHRDRAGDLWLGGTGVFRFDGTRFERVH